MNLIAYTYFINDVDIPFSDLDAQTRITNAITRWEEECLRLLLGDKLYDAFIAGLAVTPTPAQKWLDLRDGKTFDIILNGETITKTWKGLLGSTPKKSLIAYYVYCKYRNANETFFSGITQAKGKNENSDVADFNSIIVDRWNSFIKLYGEYPYASCLGWNKPFAPTANSFYYDEPSAYNFLMANITDYTDWRFTPLEMINEFGI